MDARALLEVLAAQQEQMDLMRQQIQLQLLQETPSVPQVCSPSRTSSVPLSLSLRPILILCFILYFIVRQRVSENE